MSKKLMIWTSLSVGIILFGIIMTIFGILRVSTLTVEQDFPSQYVQERNILVYLPPGYDLHFFERYPVLYLLDGEEFFLENSDESKHLWSMKKTLDRLIREERMERMIVVAVTSSEAKTDEYGLNPTGEDRTEGDASDLFARFLEEELKPFIDRKYRTEATAKHTAIAGAALGGKAALHLAWSQTDMFSKAAAMVPFYGNGEELVSDLEELEQRLERVWVDEEQSGSPDVPQLGEEIWDQKLEQMLLGLFAS